MKREARTSLFMYFMLNKKQNEAFNLKPKASNPSKHSN
jgi:hypothetical protein